MGWQPFLLALSEEFDEPLLLTWEMGNGVVFDLLLPRPAEFGDRTFCANVEFPFGFNEIRRIEFNASHLMSLGFPMPHNFGQRIDRILNLHPQVRRSSTDAVQAFSLQCQIPE